MATKLAAALHTESVRPTSLFASVDRCENVTSSAEKIITIIKLSDRHPFQFTARAPSADSQRVKRVKDRGVRWDHIVGCEDMFVWS